MVLSLRSHFQVLRLLTRLFSGFKFEMGGTWVHHSQGYTFQEMQRYNLNLDVVRTGQRGHANDYCSFNIAGDHAYPSVYSRLRTNR